MKAIVHTFQEIEQPKPAPAGHDLLVKVEAISVNPVDTKQRKIDSPAPRVLGWDAAGMRPIAVEWGYHHPESGGPGSWQAAAVIRHPMDLMEHL